MARITEAVSCTGKQRHTTKLQGLDHLMGLVRAGVKFSRLRVYRCRFCRLYHVGHKIRKR